MRALTVASKSLRVFSRQKGGLFFTFAFPLLLITVFSLVFSGQDSINIKILAVQQDNGPLANAYITALDNVFDIEKVDNVAYAEARVLDGEEVAAIIIPPGFSAHTENVRLVYDESRGEVANTTIRVVESITQQFFGMQTPISVESVHGTHKKWDATQQYVPGMAVMMTLMIGGIGVSTRLVVERKTGTFKRNLLAPIGKMSFLGGELLCGFVIGCLQVALFFSVGIFVFGMKIAGSLLLLALISAIVILLGVSFGILISAFARSPDAASGATQAFVFPASALGGLWFPIELMPGFIQSIAQVLPTTHAMNAFQDVIVRGKGLLDIAPALSVVAGYIIVFLAIGLVLFKWQE